MFGCCINSNWNCVCWFKTYICLDACINLNSDEQINEIECQTKEMTISNYENVFNFSGLGKFSDQSFHIEAKDNVSPIINPPRRVP